MHFLAALAASALLAFSSAADAWDGMAPGDAAGGMAHNDAAGDMAHNDAAGDMAPDAAPGAITPNDAAGGLAAANERFYAPDGEDAPPAAQQLAWFLTTQRTSIASHGLENVRTMADQVTGEAGQVAFASSIGGVDLPPVQGAETVESISWFFPQAWLLEMELTQAANAVAYLQASIPTTAQMRAELHGVLPDGGRVLVAQQEQAVELHAQSSPAQFELPPQATVPEGAILSFTLRLDGTHAGTILDFDSDEAPTRLDMLRLRPLDADEDGLPDSLERRLGSDPRDPRDPGDGAFDADGDGLPDAKELDRGTDPFSADSDGDGWGDGAEVQAGTDPRNGAERPTDTDADGLFDAFEDRAQTSSTRTDSNGDGLSDCLEDLDQDNLTNCEEQMWGTHPLQADSDGDGVLDGDEVRAGTDPTLHGSPPRGPQAQVAELAVGTVLFGAAAGLGYVGLARRHRT